MTHGGFCTVLAAARRRLGAEVGGPDDVRLLRVDDVAIV